MGLTEILLVEDDEHDVLIFRKEIQRQWPEATVFIAQTLSSAKQILNDRRNSLQLIFLDLTLPDSSGANTFVALAEQELDIAVIILTGVVDDALVMRALNSGIDDYLIKSELNETTLKQAVTKAISRKEKESRLKTLNDRQIAVLR